MLITYLKEEDKSSSSSVSDLVAFYKNAKKRFDEDDDFKTRSRDEVVKLQSGDKEFGELKKITTFLEKNFKSYMKC